MDIVKIRKYIGRIPWRILHKSQRGYDKAMAFLRTEIDEYRNYFVPCVSKHRLAKGKVIRILSVSENSRPDFHSSITALLSVLALKGKVRFSSACVSSIKKRHLQKCDILVVSGNLSSASAALMQNARRHGKLAVVFDDGAETVSGAAVDISDNSDIVFTERSKASGRFVNIPGLFSFGRRTALKKMVRFDNSESRLPDRFYAEITKRLYDYNVLVVGAPIATLDIDVKRPFLHLKKKYFANYQLRDISRVKMGEIRRYDILVISREVEPKALKIMKRAQMMGKKVIYSWDDNFFEIPDEFGKLAAYYKDPLRTRTLEEILRRADIVKTSSKYLYEVSRRYSRKVVLDYYTFDFSITDGVVPENHSDEMRIGFFGNPGRDREFEYVFEALKRLDEKNPNIVFEFFGHVPKGAEQFRRVNVINPEKSYEAALKIFAKRGWDIGLSPLANTPFNRAKGPTKYRDYAACGCAGVYSKGEVFDSFIRHGENGMIVENTADDWYKALSSLVKNKALRRKIIKNAYADVFNNYSCENAAAVWEKLIKKKID